MTGPTRDAVIEHVANAASKWSAVEKVMLFGSRARGDARRGSDYDFAVYVPSARHEEWARWCLDTEESSPSLSKLDLVLASDPLTEELQNAIRSEGVKIYEKQKG